MTKTKSKTGLKSSQDFNEVPSEEASKKRIKRLLKSIGVSGTLVTGYLHQDEYLTELLGTAGQEKFFKMEFSNSTIRKLIHALNNPIKSATWSIEPFSDSPKDMKAAQVAEQIFFKDFDEGWKGKLDEIMTFPWRGHSVFEIVHKNRWQKDIGYYTGLENLAFRDQRTIEEWHYSRSGIFEKIQQTVQGDIQGQGTNIDIPAQNLIIFFNEKKGNDIGFPFLRMLYGNYKRIELYKTLQAIGNEKGAIGTPKLYLPEGVDEDDESFAWAERQLTAFTQAESAYFILPKGYELEIENNATFDPAKLQVAIKAENEEIAGSLVAMFLEMGIGGNAAVGSSTSESIEFFRDGIKYIADRVCDTINHKLMPNLMGLNFGDTLDGLPSLVHHGISDEAGEELMKVVTGYTKEGVITKDEQLEDHVRKAHNLPKKVKGEEVEQGGTEDDNNEPEIEEEENEEVELNTKSKNKTPKKLMDEQGDKISQEIRKALEFASRKYTVDVINRYNQLSEKKKQKATDKIKLAGQTKLKKEIKRQLSQTANMAINMARLEVPSAKDVELKNHDADMVRMIDKYGEDVKEIQLNDFSSLPSYIQVLVAKQADLISEHSMQELKSRLDFAFSGSELNTNDPEIIRQAMQDEGTKFYESNQVKTKGDNVASLVVNEGRNTFFFEDDVLEEIHSFTFMNASPVSTVCKELAGVTFATNDVSSLRYSPPLHHNCKSYLRANLKTSKGVDRLEIQPLAPSAKAIKSITL